MVIGASSGIGREVSMVLLGRGWRLWVVARRTDLLLSLKAANPGMVETVTMDVTDEGAPGALVSLARSIGGVELFFYSAGWGMRNPCLDPGVEEATVRLNALAFTRMVDAMFGFMAGSGGGRIAAISSIAGTRGLGEAPSYSATKAYQSAYLEALDQLSRMRGLGVGITDIRPGFVDTGLLSGHDRYPMLMDARAVALAAVRAVERGRRCCVVDWRYRVLVALWRLVPGWLWVRLDVHARKREDGPWQTERQP